MTSFSRRFAVNPFSNVKSYYLPLLQTYTKIAKTSKTAPQKETTPSSQPAGGKTPVEPRLEECIPGGARETPTSRPIKPRRFQPAKVKKRKKTSTSEDPKPKKNPVRKPKKYIVALPADVIQRLREKEEEDEDDGSELVARVKKTIEAPKAAESVVVEEIPPRVEGVLEKDSGKVPESSKIEDASHRDEKKAGMSEGTGSEALHSKENAPSGSLGAIDIGDSPILPAFSEEAIREAQATRTPEVDGAHGGEDPFYGYFIGVDDATDLSEASSLLDEAQQALKRKVERIEQFHKEVNMMKAETLGWKGSMDCFAGEKEVARAQLSSVESQL
ncbi:uncharacterized protein [Nicotiana tomentosiformis]|uniref:uncharacterized protein n=1 Tax=Nicotiana tomentosiformis TaxID=4098 RepID=UPI00388C99DF